MPPLAIPATVLAHPLTPIPPDAFSLTPVVAMVLPLVVLAMAARATAPLAEPAADGPLRRSERATRTLGVAAIVLVVASSPVGDAGAPLQLTQSFGLELLWPALLVVALAGRLWQRFDPWDTVLRLADRRPDVPATEPTDVRGAALVAVVLGAVQARYTVLSATTAVGAVLAGYAVALAALAAVRGRAAARSWEVFGLLADWASRNGRAVARWTPPAGAESVLAVVAATALVHRARLNRVYGGADLVNRSPRATVVVLVAVAVAIGALLVLLERWARRRGVGGSVLAACVPLVCALVVAGLLRRTMVAVQLLPAHLGDPFERGWDPFGRLGDPVDSNPFGSLVQQGLAGAVLLLGAALAGRVLSRRCPDPPTRLPGVVAVLALGITGTVVLLAQPPQPIGFSV